MKRITVILLIIVILLAFKFIQESKTPPFVISPLGDIPRSTIIKPSVSSKVSNFKQSLFVPYWSIGTKIIQGYDELIYFGVSVNEQGIDKEDKGYTGISQFLKIANKVEKKLFVVRMTDSSFNSLVLEKKVLQSRIIGDSINTAKANGFDGIILDFELSSLSFESVIKKINFFMNDFYSSTKQNNLMFKITIYGDTFYRFRPYDVKFLGNHADEVMIMAYDFHKARGNPGPNFPLNGKENYGYDFTKMISDFSTNVSKNKLTVVFGLFGYDWIIDEKSQSLEQAKALSLEQIKKTFLNGCDFKYCLIKRDKISSETKITYTDSTSQKHVVWFEDLDSIEEKTNYLKSQGISSTSLWAHSYF